MTSDGYVLCINHYIGDAGAIELALQLSSDTRIYENSLSESNRNPSGIFGLELRHCAVGEAGVRALMNTLCHNTRITSLDLCDYTLGDTCAKALADMLMMNSTITDLRLDFKNVTPYGVQCLAQALRINSTLESITFFSSWPVFDAVIKTCSVNPTITYMKLVKMSLSARSKWWNELFVFNSTLTVLVLLECELACNDPLSMEHAASINTSIQWLNFSYSYHAAVSGFPHVNSFIRAFSTNTSICSVNLSGCDVDRHAIQTLSQALQCNTSLMCVKLNMNFMQSTTVRPLVEAAFGSHSLVFVDLDFNQFDKQAMSRMLDIQNESLTAGGQPVVRPWHVTDQASIYKYMSSVYHVQL